MFCLNDDAKNLYAAVLARVHGVRLTVALAHDPAAVSVYERGGVDVAINPRQVVAEEFVRFAHDPRIRQIAMLEGDRFEILDLTVRPESELAGKEFDDLPQTGSVIGALIRDGSDLPARLRLTAGRRPGDHLRGVAPRGAGREGALITGVDVGNALDLIGGVLKWVGAAFVARRRRARLRRAGVAVPRRRRRRGRRRSAARPDHRPEEAPPSARAKLPGRRLDLAAGPGVRRAAVPVHRRAAALEPLDAYFESVSGFTATGATVATDVEGLSRSMLFWRQFSTWLGGMGIIILAVAVLPRLRIGGRQLLQSELAGPTEIERFSETIRETARRLWTLYVGLTIGAVVVLARSAGPASTRR